MVWYHNPAYWTLPSTGLADTLKFILLGWSMPFFYATSARFALEPPRPRTFQRIAGLLALIGGYFVLYDGISLLAGRGMILSCAARAEGCTPLGVFNAVRTVGSTPGYYLSDVVSLLILGAVFAALGELFGRWSQYGLVALVAIAVLFGDSLLWGLFLNPLGIGCFLWATVWWLVVRERLAVWSPARPLSRGGFLVTLVILLIWGVLNWWLAKDVYWISPPTVLIFGFLLLLILSIDFLVRSESRIVRVLSDWGQRYSLGFLLLHQLWYDLTARSSFVLGAHGMPPEGIYVTVGIAITGLTAATVVVLERYFPAAVSIGATRRH